jgi:teichoic acid glycerol-phosphate primase
MVREIAITIYLFIFSTIFKVCKWLPLQPKVTFVVSFSENNKSLYKEMIRQDFSCRTIFLTTSKMHSSFMKLEHSTSLLFELKRPLQFVRSIYHLATSKVVFVDNYYGFLAKSSFKDSVECIQLWHANGAIKKFGLKDPSIKVRGPRALNRFQTVYDRFSKVIVGSEEMATIFKQAFNTPDQNILRSGIPRTDVFFDESAKDRTIKKLLSKYPFFQNKKIVLYAPTYRDNELEHFKLHLQLDKLQELLGNEYVLLLKLHPAVKNKVQIPAHLDHFVFDFTEYYSMNDLLFISDLLITDYSSIPFEYSLLNRPMIFYLYDFEEYQQERGLWDNYLELLPGPVANSTEEVCHLINENKFDYNKIKDFSTKWNQYSTGKSSENVLRFVKKVISEKDC